MDELVWIDNGNATWSGVDANGERIANIVGTWTGGYRGFFATPAAGFGPTGEMNSFEEARAAVEKRIAEQETK
jgi:hypothetical protein